tara:strand:- start:2495 stop:3073 length:579 start_codon:yes stop_codon:yes gene_type:complete
MKNSKLLYELDAYQKKYFKKDYLLSSNLNSEHGNVFAYGSTPYITFQQLINNFTIKPKRFVVVGCSIGWVNFYWNDLFPEVPTKGIDLHNFRILFGKDLIDKYELKNIELSIEDFYDFDFNDGDLIWQSNLCFPTDKLNEVNSSIINDLNNFGIISYKPLSSCKNIDVDNIKTNVLKTSWSDRQSFFTYEKL